VSITFIDIFCGAGGSSLGLAAAGLELKLAANHWPRAIETHSANFPAAEHLCADINGYDMRRLPRARVLWASPICQESSPAGGRRKKRGPAGQGSLLEEEGHVAAAGWERTRATAYDVLRATEVWAYDAVLVENVTEFATGWPLFTWWLEAMTRLGYRHKTVCVSSAHVGGGGNPQAPQWRDRLYIVFTRHGIRMPALEPRPLAWCRDCGTDIRACQSWKSHTQLGRARIGKYRQQYTYTCPNTARRHTSLIVEPYVLPAAAAINWADPGARIGDRSRPLARSIMARIHAGLAMLAREPSPGLLVPAGGTWNTAPASVAEPMRTRMANPKGMEALVIPPFVIKNYGGNCQPASTLIRIGHPLSPITTRDHHALVIPYRKGEPKTTAEPLHTVATRDSAGLLTPAAPDPEDCWFRMLKAREHLRAQRFPDSYIVTGNQGEQTMQAGNAVSANVAQWLGSAVTEALA
jgi:DNA (cytosine-5)-methyltransferase 1